MRNVFTVRFYASTGCNPIPSSHETRSEARDTAARTLRAARAEGRPCAILETGAEWEIGERPAAVTVDDESGTLRIRPPLMVECEECGFDFAPETADDRGDGVPTLPRGRWYVCEGCANPEPETVDELETEPETVELETAGAEIGHVCGRDC